jgi:hypothetical protein
MPRYSTDMIGKKMRHLGTVEAATEKAAIEEAAKQFGIAALRAKIVVTKARLTLLRRSQPRENINPSASKRRADLPFRLKVSPQP